MQASKHDLVDWLVEALVANGGRGTIVDLCKHIWKRHEQDLRKAGDLFYTWQYHVRWAAYELRRTRKMKPAEISPVGIWELVKVT
jgi:hypothetical protein